MLLAISMNAFITPRISEAYSVEFAILVTVFVCFISIIFSVILIAVDKVYGKELELKDAE